MITDTQTPTPATLTDRFHSLIEGLCRAVGVGNAGGEWAEPVIYLIWEWLRRIGARFAALAARVQAGTLPPARWRPASPEPVLVMRSPQVLPRHWAWLVPLLPDAEVYIEEFHSMLAELEMRALVAGAPQLGRILRPLSCALGSGLPIELRLPPSPKAAEAARRREARARRTPRWLVKQRQRLAVPPYEDRGPLWDHPVSLWGDVPKKRG